MIFFVFWMVTEFVLKKQLSIREIYWETIEENHPKEKQQKNGKQEKWSIGLFENEKSMIQILVYMFLFLLLGRTFFICVCHFCFIIFWELFRISGIKKSGFLLIKGSNTAMWFLLAFLNYLQWLFKIHILIGATRYSTQLQL